ncbi:hypothetical protein CEP51_013636 [Fusarium floridanum]|uniref:Uncharacterized protein n=1 Tax=Fusarium floridanum TaxID=1325733 RepID=A0A428Q7Z5_9HYPO|nr:hypothetical protein CEP51_013636 [Fusarium floridanum]
MLAMHSEFIDPIRQEIASTLAAEGWEKNALFNKKLLDSAVKEAQRLKPGGLC